MNNHPLTEKIQSQHATQNEEFNVDETELYKYHDERNLLRKFLGRVDLTLTDTLLDLTRASLEEYVGLHAPMNRPHHKPPIYLRGGPSTNY